LIMSSLTLQANLFHEFHPMGGVSARLADGDIFSCAIEEVRKKDRQKINKRRIRCIFMADVVSE
jgi:hypothetical protein